MVYSRRPDDTVPDPLLDGMGDHLPPGRTADLLRGYYYRLLNQHQPFAQRLAVCFTSMTDRAHHLPDPSERWETSLTLNASHARHHQITAADFLERLRAGRPFIVTAADVATDAAKREVPANYRTLATVIDTAAAFASEWPLPDAALFEIIGAWAGWQRRQRSGGREAPCLMATYAFGVPPRLDDASGIEQESASSSDEVHPAADPLIVPPTPHPFTWNPAYQTNAQLHKQINALVRDLRADCVAQAEALRQRLAAGGWPQARTYSRRSSTYVRQAKRLFRHVILHQTFEAIADAEYTGGVRTLSGDTVAKSVRRAATLLEISLDAAPRTLAIPLQDS